MTTGLALLVFFSILSGSTVYGATSTWPAPIPLFHKSPYFNAWIGASSNISNSPVPRWPQFFRPNRRDFAWFVGLRVDNTSYVVQGRKDEFSLNYTEGATVSSYIMPTQTRFSIAAGPVLINITYLTPIELQDWTLHSLPFAYATFDISSSDGSPHAIQLYTDASGRIVSSDDTNTITWNTTVTDKSIYHIVQQRTLRALTENFDNSEDGSLIWAYTATPNVSMTWQTSAIGISRGNFSLHGKMENTSDTNFRAINSQWPVVAYALDLGSITRTSNPLVIGIGLVRDPVVSYRTAKTTQSLSHLWYSKWGNLGSAIEEFLTSYSSASSRANAFDDRIQLNATALASQLRISDPTATKLVDLHILNLRQTIGSLEFTTLGARNRLEMDDVRVFMKDVGYSRRTSPVDILYASFPAFLFFNTTLAGKLLEPLLEFQDSTLYRNAYAAPDLGNSWPVIQGNITDQTLLAIDSCGAMLIMVLAHARKSGDGKLLHNHYNLLRKWAEYLVQSTRQPGSYISSDGLYSSSANLALKGIMGLYAMGQINKILEANGADASKTPYYLDLAKKYAQDWLKEAVSSDHVVANYGSNATWAMIYNLFAPRLLGATIIPEQIYETQASWYASRSAKTFGLPYDGTQALAKAHWTLLSASSVFNATSSEGRDGLISMVHSRAFWQSGTDANPATYSTIDGTLADGSASPAMGAIYSLLALNLPDRTITLPSGSLQAGKSGSIVNHNVPVIVGATFGVLGGLIILASVVVIFIRRRRRLQSVGPLEESHPGPSNIMPFTAGVQEQNNPGKNAPQPSFRTLHPEKFATILSSDSIPQASTPTGSDVVLLGGNSLVASSSSDGGSSSREEQLKREVERLGRVVDLLTSQQVQQRVPYDSPPMYPD